MIEETIAKWHAYVESGDPAELDALLDDDVVFHSPIVHTPQEGKALTTMYLMAAKEVFSDGDGDFTYLREVMSGDNAVLEFSSVADGITINGVDMIRINDQGKIIDFKVMVRPLKAVNLMHQKMMAMLEALKSN